MKKINGKLLGGLIITGTLLLLAITSRIYTPYDTEAMNVADKFLAPSIKHIFGTDNFGRDIFSRTLVGLSDTMIISGCTILIGGIVGTFIGCVTGYCGGRVDDAIMRFNDALSSIPSVLLAIVLVGVMGSDTTTVILALGIVFIPSFARMSRSEVVKQRKLEYVMSAKLAGASHIRILFVHILPNCKNTMLSAIIVGFNNAILAEASLSFLGIGVQPPQASLGSMLKDSQTFIRLAPWYSIFPGVTIVILIVGFVLLGEGIKMKKRG